MARTVLEIVLSGKVICDCKTCFAGVQKQYDSWPWSSLGWKYRLGKAWKRQMVLAHTIMLFQKHLLPSPHLSINMIFKDLCLLKIVHILLFWTFSWLYFVHIVHFWLHKILKFSQKNQIPNLQKHMRGRRFAPTTLNLIILIKVASFSEQCTFVRTMKFDITRKRSISVEVFAFRVFWIFLSVKKKQEAAREQAWFSGCNWPIFRSKNGFIWHFGRMRNLEF